MQPKDVMAYGCDYSAREFTPAELDRYPGVPIRWLARYIGYPGNRKCISAYPGAYRAHTDSGRPVVLFHQVAYRDFEGGYASGRAHAQIAVADARSKAVGWDGETPILAAFDRRMPEKRDQNGFLIYRAIPIAEVRDYMRGFVSVLGHDTSGFYGFEDTMRLCVDEDWVRFRMQCGARSAHIPGITAWQENNEQPLLLGTQTDRLELYVELSAIGGSDMPSAKEVVDEIFSRRLYFKIPDPKTPGATIDYSERFDQVIADIYAQMLWGIGRNQAWGPGVAIQLRGLLAAFQQFTPDDLDVDALVARVDQTVRTAVAESTIDVDVTVGGKSIDTTKES